MGCKYALGFGLKIVAFHAYCICYEYLSLRLDFLANSGEVLLKLCIELSKIVPE